MTYAIFPTQQAFNAWVSSVNNAMEYPDGITVTYAVPWECIEGWAVRLKPWLMGDVGQSARWLKSGAIALCASAPGKTEVEPTPVEA